MSRIGLQLDPGLRHAHNRVEDPDRRILAIPMPQLLNLDLVLVAEGGLDVVQMLIGSESHKVVAMHHD